ncbi:MAG: ATP-binding protein, partial [Acidimicrobiia bacterium]
RIFVGRDDELERLGQLWKEATAGELRVALLAGEPGVGKTRLATELARRVHDEGATVLAGRCDEDLGVPYQPFVEVLRHFLDHAPQPSGRMGRYGGELARLVPELSERVPELPAPLRSDPETERYRLFDAVAAWLAVTSVEEPLLVVLDDLQWAARPTLLLLRHLVRAGGGRVLVLCTYRDTELTHDHPLVELVADLRRQGGVERLSLSGLDDVGVRTIVEQASGRTLDEDGLALAQAVYQETEGNPFFVREVLRHLAETGAVERQAEGWTTRLPVDQLGIPEGVRDVVGRRLARLSGDTNHTLRIAAVVGAEFELGVVQVAGDLDEETLLGAVEEAAGARLVTEVSATRFRFAHALVRATLYESLTAARKTTLHRKTAEAIETIHEGALDVHVPALAHHWARASAPVTDTTKAVDYAQRAGDQALAQLAHDQAANHYASGLELLDAAGVDPADPRRLELLIGRGEAQRRGGDPGYRQTLLDAGHLAEQRGDGLALARAALANNRGNIYSTVFAIDTARVSVLEAAIDAVGADDLALRARLLANLGLELCWDEDPRRRLTLSDEALRVARELGDQVTLAHVLLARDYTVGSPDNAVERMAATSELLTLAEVLGDPVVSSRALMLRFKAAMELGDMAEAERCLARNQALVAGLGQAALIWSVMIQHAGLALLRGDLTTAEARIFAAYEHAMATGQPDGPMWLLSQLSLLRFEQGRSAEIDETVRQAVERTPTTVGVKVIYGSLLVEMDRLQDAGDIFDEMAAAGFVAPSNNVMWLRTVAECAFLCARLGKAASAPMLRSILEPYANQLVAITQGGAVTGSVTYYLGLLSTTTGNWQEAEGCFAAAAATHERIGAATWLARTRLEWARMLLARAEPGDAERAHDLLRQALATARELGLANVERQAVELLQASLGPTNG